VLSQFTALVHRPPVSWWDVADILIVAILIYEALKLIKGTRAMQMAIGSAFVLVLFYASRWFPLQTVNWLIRNLLLYGVFAAIVLFQSDIRRALSHLGRAPFFRYFARSEQVSEMIEEILTAAGMLAKGRVGAIIAIEREIGLRNYVESGIRLDASVSYDLLTTIFQPMSPLHDGAVIIQEDRIAAAACFLPLTVSPRLDRDLGTRHRAAIGLTEECDAVAVVVSEERGEMSLALDGRIERGLTTDDLRGRLQELILLTRRARGHAVPAAELDV
jgi:diadenylate cyclase